MDPTRARKPDIEDLATARALIARLRDQLTKFQRENASLWHQLDVLCQRLFGKKSERSIRGSRSVRSTSSPMSPAPSPNRSKWTRATHPYVAMRSAGRQAAARCRGISSMRVGRSRGEGAGADRRAAPMRDRRHELSADG